jgi:hypothetical protein
MESRQSLLDIFYAIVNGKILSPSRFNEYAVIASSGTAFRSSDEDDAASHENSSSGDSQQYTQHV